MGVKTGQVKMNVYYIPASEVIPEISLQFSFFFFFTKWRVKLDPSVALS